MFTQTARAIAANPEARLIVWPEAALPLYLDESTEFAERLRGSVPPEKAGVAAITTEVMQRGAGDRDGLALAKVVEDAGEEQAVVG